MALPGARAQGAAWPTPTVTIVVPYPPGGSADILARALAEKLGERLGRTVLVDNRAGAGTAIGAKAVAAARPDGATLLMGTVTSQAINPAMAKVGYDPVADFAAVAPLCSIPFVLVAHPSLGVSTVAELVAAAKARPGAIAYASAGQGTSNHLAGELFAAATQTKFLHVPYKGSAPALNDTLAGHTPLMFDLQATALPHVQAGRLKALAVTSKARSPKLPAVPTMAESGLPGYEVTAWFGLFAPAGLTRPLQERLAAETASAVGDAAFRARLQEIGAEPESASLDAYGAYVRAEAAKWATTVRTAGITATGS